jgi:hypothetical protein
MSAARPASRKLTGRQVRDLLAGQPGAAADPDVSRLVNMDARRLPEGGVLVVLANGAGRLYESRDELLAMLGDVASQEARNPLRELLPLGRGFVAEVPRLAGELAAQGGGELDGTERSLDAVDRLVGRLGAAAFRRPEQFQRLVAYVGEVVRGITGGEWRTVLGDDGQTWEPWIVEPDGRRPHPVFGLVLKELHEWNRASSIRGVVAGRLGPRPPRS